MKKIISLLINLLPKELSIFFNQLTGHSLYISLLFIWGIWNSGMNIV